LKVNRISGRQEEPERGAARAFTMVEVIVALTLLGITLVAVFEALRTCAQATHHARMLSGSVLLAERLLTEVRLDQNRAFATRDGGEDLYRWQVRVAPTPVEGLGALHVQVTWLEQQRQQQYDLFSLIHMKSFEQQQ
jgi:prepilin-type N-terminal cleavage/methylation domain-containing protein